jgi:ATP-dependent Clp protease protease subunit
MFERKIPTWMGRAREFAARVQSPVGTPFAAKKDAQVAKLYLYDAIGRDPWTGAGIDPTDVVAAVTDAKGSSALEVYINSPGGYVFDGIAIFNAIRAFDGPKTTYVDGVAASIASIIALAGDQVVTNEGAMWMIHDPMGGVMSFGTAAEIEDDARKVTQALRKVRENLVDIYVSATGLSAADLSSWMTSETWMTAAEAKARGFTDEVSSPPTQSSARSAVPGSPRAVSPRVVADMARVQARSLSDRFAAASRGVKPGQPGMTQHPHAGTAGRKTT